MMRHRVKLWLTYAWIDNENSEIDHVYHELIDAGLQVHLDRTQVVAGQRLWPQIDAGITDPSRCDGWAIYATKRSLESEPCLEEIAYALDRALRTRGTTFPLIGIFPEPLDRALIPSAIATRLYVNLRDPEWKASIVSSLTHNSSGRSIPRPSPVICSITTQSWGPCIEFRPRSGRWHPFFAMVPRSERGLITSIFTGPSGHPVNWGMVQTGSCSLNDYEGVSTTNLVDSLTSAYVSFSELPSSIMFGSEGDLYTRTIK